MNMTKRIITLILVLVPFPAMALSGSFKDVIGYVLSILYIVIPILFALAFIIFFWGLSKFILNAGNPVEVKKGREYMMWGILALFILVSFRSIISIISKELELGDARAFPFLPGEVPNNAGNYNYRPTLPQ